jgi:hypothetical protein
MQVANPETLMRSNFVTPDDDSIDRYVDKIIRAVPETNRPGADVICRQGCPKANWVREGQRLRCYCHSMGAFSWPKLELNDCADRKRALSGTQ